MWFDRTGNKKGPIWTDQSQRGVYLPLVGWIESTFTGVRLLSLSNPQGITWQNKQVRASWKRGCRWPALLFVTFNCIYVALFTLCLKQHSSPLPDHIAQQSFHRQVELWGKKLQGTGQFLSMDYVIAHLCFGIWYAPRLALHFKAWFMLLRCCDGMGKQKILNIGRSASRKHIALQLYRCKVTDVSLYCLRGSDCFSFNQTVNNSNWDMEAVFGVEAHWYWKSIVLNFLRTWSVHPLNRLV